MSKQIEAMKMAIKDELIAKFRAGGAGEGMLIPAAWLYDDFLPTLDRKEQRAMEEMIAEMIEEGMIEYVSGHRPTYRLTEEGAARLC